MYYCLSNDMKLYLPYYAKFFKSKAPAEFMMPTDHYQDLLPGFLKADIVILKESIPPSQCLEQYEAKLFSNEKEVKITLYLGERKIIALYEKAIERAALYESYVHKPYN